MVHFGIHLAERLVFRSMGAMDGGARCARGLKTLSLLHIPRARRPSSECLSRCCSGGWGRRRDAAHSAVADGPRAGLRPLKWEPGTERPACAGLPAGASSAGALDGGDVDAHAEQQHKALSGAWSSIAAIGNHPTVAPATGAPQGSPSKEGRSVPGSHFSGRRPARGPSATAEWAASPVPLTVTNTRKYERFCDASPPLKMCRSDRVENPRQRWVRWGRHRKSASGLILESDRLPAPRVRVVGAWRDAPAG
jgi:hypothetical protein